MMTISKLCLATAIAILLTMGPSRLSGPAAADEVLARGQFVGKKGHKTSGGVAVVKTDNGLAVVLERDFSFDGAPDPKLGFGRNGYDPATQFSALKANKGMQRYEIPGSFEPGAYTEIWVWCEKFSVPLGVAKLRQAQGRQASGPILTVTPSRRTPGGLVPPRGRRWRRRNVAFLPHL